MKMTIQPPDSSVPLYDQILEDVATGYYASGQRLKVGEMAERYGTSVNPIRETLRTMQGEGIVQFRENRGAIVAPVDAESLRNIFELLKLLEPYMVEAFAATCSDQDVDELQSIQDRLSDVPMDDRAAYSYLDTRFHDVIARRHYNDRVVRVWQVQRRVLGAMGRRLAVPRARHRAAMEEHQQLIDACRHNDVEAASAAIARHLDGAGELLTAQLRMENAMKRSA
jgi:DNA-binding GntR family transcriptional regulator